MIRGKVNRINGKLAFVVSRRTSCLNPLLYILNSVLIFILVVNCGFPPRPKNGSFIGELTTFQSSLRFKCDDGFELEGSETRMCTSDKNWSGKEVTCSGKYS